MQTHHDEHGIGIAEKRAKLQTEIAELEASIRKWDDLAQKSSDNSFSPIIIVLTGASIFVLLSLLKILNVYTMLIAVIPFLIGLFKMTQDDASSSVATEFREF